MIRTAAAPLLTPWTGPPGGARGGGPATIGVTLHGRALPWNVWAEIRNPLEGHFFERFTPGTFLRSLARDRARVKLLLDHGLDPRVARRPLGPLRSVYESGLGLDYEAGLLDVPYVAELVPGIRAGLFGMSVRFAVEAADVARRPAGSELNPLGLEQRTYRRARLVELSLTAFPSYTGTSADVRSRP
ncbi:MAG: HK97 family phage prohead protease [Gaiella sp.]